MAERFKATALKAVDGKLSVSSNLTSPAIPPNNPATAGFSFGKIMQNNVRFTDFLRKVHCSGREGFPPIQYRFKNNLPGDYFTIVKIENNVVYIQVCIDYSRLEKLVTFDLYPKKGERQISYNFERVYIIRPTRINKSNRLGFILGYI